MAFVVDVDNGKLQSDSDFYSFINGVGDGNSFVAQSGSLQVTQSASPGLSVLVATGRVFLYVGSKNSYYGANLNAATTLTIGSNSSGSTRIDIICVKYDTGATSNTAGDNIVSLQVVAGNPGSGVPATPANYYKIAEVSVINGAVGPSHIVNADITDKRSIGNLSVNTSSNSNGWAVLNSTLTYSSVDGHTFVINSSADVTGSVQPGDRISFTNNATTFYGIVTAITSSTITIYGGTQFTVANSAITNPFYSHQKAPFGFNTRPDWWTERLSNNLSYQQNPPTTGTWYNISSSTLKLDVPIGAWRVRYAAAIYSNNASATTVSVMSTFSTTTNSETDSDFSAEVTVSGASADINIIAPITREKLLVLASKTTYTLLLKARLAASQIFINPDALSPTILEAICAYL